MTTHTTRPFLQQDLRARAQARLEESRAALSPARDASRAMRVLFDLATSPDTAPDALALLHELQVHQVELDLQNEELAASRAELESAYSHLHEWLHAAPSAQLVLDERGCVTECNTAALRDLNRTEEMVLGQRLEVWLHSAEMPHVLSWLSQARQSTLPVPMALRLRAHNAAGMTVCAAACANPMAAGCLLSWVNVPLNPMIKSALSH
jgi:PAS domain-containing protein